eukprot:1198425-Pleurochrysis_carterae.AAC.2
MGILRGATYVNRRLPVELRGLSKRILAFLGARGGCGHRGGRGGGPRGHGRSKPGEHCWAAKQLGGMES